VLENKSSYILKGTYKRKNQRLVICLKETSTERGLPSFDAVGGQLLIMIERVE